VRTNELTKEILSVISLYAAARRFYRQAETYHAPTALTAIHPLRDCAKLLFDVLLKRVLDGSLGRLSVRRMSECVICIHDAAVGTHGAIGARLELHELPTLMIDLGYLRPVAKQEMSRQGCWIR
jgi:hypothetical protein